MIGKSTSAKIANMSIVCAFLVVCIHVAQGVEVALGTSSWWIRKLLFWGFSSLAVPYFFVVSGFFIARHINEDGWYKRELHRRIYSLIIPLLVWCLIYVFITAILIVCANVVHSRPLLTNLRISAFEVLTWFGIIPWETPAVPAGWYIRMLFILVIISPLLKKIVESRIVLCALSVVVVIYLGIYSTVPFLSKGPSCFLQFGFSFEGVLYYSLGMWLQVRRIRVSIKSIWAIILGAVGVGLLFIGAILSMREVACSGVLLRLAIPFNMLFIWHYISDATIPRWLTSSTFPVYLSHQLVIMILGGFLDGYIFVRENALLYFLMCVLVFLISVVCSVSIRLLPATLVQLLTGGR